jgi:FAD/FMN-containing dehydrogenase
VSQETLIINDVTKLNPIPVWGVAKPTSIEEVQSALARTDVPVSVGGGHFSMGGQTASPGSLHLDMRSMNKVILFSPLERMIRVQTGIRWCDIQKFIDPHGFAVKIMQTYANFTVGGSLSVNVHGRYIGLGPLVLSVRNIRVVLLRLHRRLRRPRSHRRGGA